jgi:hypothetical protein
MCPHNYCINGHELENHRRSILLAEQTCPTFLPKSIKYEVWTRNIFFPFSESKHKPNKIPAEAVSST